jgi:hypothetical protein
MTSCLKDFADQLKSFKENGLIRTVIFRKIG